MITWADRKHERATTAPSSKQPSKRTLFTDRESQTTKTSRQSKEPTILTTSGESTGEITMAISPSKQQTKFITTADTAHTTTKTNSDPSQQSKNATTLDDRELETIRTSTSSKQPSKHFLSSNPKIPTLTKVIPTSKQPIKMADDGNERTATIPPFEQTSAVNTSADSTNKTTKTHPPLQQSQNLTTSSDREQLTTGTTLNPASKESTTLIITGRETTKVHQKPYNNLDPRRYVGAIKLDHFIVLICFIVIGAFIFAFIVWSCVRRPERPTCAGYILV